MQRSANLKVMTLNVAHGRALAKHQAMLDRRTIEFNLARIADLVRSQDADIVGLQEADGPSFWSGNFNHVEHVGHLADMRYRFRGEHVAFTGSRTQLAYGTAVLSRWPLHDTRSHVFPPSPPTPKKGFVQVRVAWGDSGQHVDVVSVHLDFLSKRARRKQIEAMVAALEGDDRPLIVLGDMNCRWDGRDASLRTLAEKLRVRPYKPTQKLATFPAKRPRRRIDWILISPHFEFVDYFAVADTVSDHLGVVAELRLKGNGAAG